MGGMTITHGAVRALLFCTCVCLGMTITHGVVCALLFCFVHAYVWVGPLPMVYGVRCSFLLYMHMFGYA